MAALAAFSDLALIGWAILLGAYLSAAGGAATQIWIRTKRAATLALPALFFSYHLAYGTGSLAGLRWLVGKLDSDNPPGGGTTALGTNS